MRLKLEFGPMEFGQRWQIYATMATTVMDHAYNLKDVAEVIVTQLAHQIIREYKQIDFSRVKPFPPSNYWPKGGYTIPGRDEPRL